MLRPHADPLRGPKNPGGTLLGARQFLVCCGLSVFVALPQLIQAQGTFEPLVMRTGAGVALQTQSLPFNTDNLSLAPALPLEFGFATLESPRPGEFGDSFTISVQSSAGIIYLLTADANGVQWAPVVPGALTISEAAIQRTSTAFVVSPEGLTPIAAYRLDYPLPGAWGTLPLTINADLFDNQDVYRSLAYIRVIPEPSSTLLIGLAAALWCGWRRRQRPTKSQRMA